MATETKTWTEIKLRNPDTKTCTNINLVMMDYREASASKALERLINNYLRDKKNLQDRQDQINDLQEQLRTKEKEIAIYKYKLQRIISSYDAFREEVATDVDLSDVKPRKMIR